MFSSFICCDAYSSKCSLCISSDYSLFCFGYGKYGSNGFDKYKILTPNQIPNLTNIKMISRGLYHIICINFDGDTFSFGKNSCGKLGINKNETILHATHIPQKLDIPPIKQVSCGFNFSICLTEDNVLYSFGENNRGQLGLGNDNKYYASPQLIPDFNNIEYIVCGGCHCICKTYNSEFYSWGYNEDGQSYGGKNYSKPTQCNNWPDNIISIKCGSYYSLLLTLEGKVYSFGKNYSVQLGINDTNIKSMSVPTLIKEIPEIQRIECGNSHSMCIDINNNLWVFGRNNNGQLGLGDTKNRCKPILHPTLSNIIDISSGGNHTFVKTIDNKIYAFGANQHSQLGITTSEDQLSPIQVLVDNEDIWCSTIGKSRAKSARK